MIFMKCVIFFSLLVFGNFCIAQSVIEENGKQGIIDNNGKVILPPIYDAVKYYPDRIENFFLVRQNYKYAYVYKATHFHKPKIRKGNSVYREDKELDSPYWVISDFEYDTIDPFFNFNRKYVTELFMKYKKDGMYGLIHIESRAESRMMMFTEIYHSRLGKISILPPMYNQFFFNDKSIFPIQKDDKFGFVFVQKNDCTDSFYVDNTETKYDELPRHLFYGTDHLPYIRVKENQKYGLLKFDVFDSCKLVYQIPCKCETEIKQVSSSIFVCPKIEAGTMVVYNEDDKQRFELPAIEKEGGIFEVFNTKNGDQFLSILYTNYGKSNREIDNLERIEDIYVVDIKNQKIKISFQGNENVSYEYYSRIDKNLGLIMRKTKINNGFSYDFFDIEREQIVFSLPPAKKGYHYIMETNFSCDNLLILYYKTGKGFKKNLGCYDYETKTYTKGQCKKCE